MLLYKIPGKPIAWARARRMGNRYFDPQYEAKKNIRNEVLESLKGFDLPLKGLLLVQYAFVFEMPKSWSQKKKDLNLFNHHTGHVDLDNLIKFQNDMFNEVIWEDDSQIADITAAKFWGYEAVTSVSVKILEKIT